LPRWLSQGRLFPTSVALLLFAGASGVIAGCGSESPTGPDASVLPLKAGRQLLTLAGFAISADPSLPACTPLGQPPAGTSVNTVVLLTNEGAAWVARSAPQMGTIELRLHAATSGSYRVAGTMTGSAADIGLMGVVRDVSVSLAAATGAGSATLDGETTPSSSFVVGRATGAVRFSDSQGLSSTCTAIQWSMQPY
jgi:hypothetical protein